MNEKYKYFDNIHLAEAKKLEGLAKKYYKDFTGSVNSENEIEKIHDEQMINSNPSEIPTALLSNKNENAVNSLEDIESIIKSGSDFYFLKECGKTNSYYFIPQDNKIPYTNKIESFDPNIVRKDFPILNQEINGHQLVWFDNAATTQKPNVVIDAISNYYRTINSNIHRGVHELATKSTDVYESARNTIQEFLGASDPNEIIFVRGTTEGINLIAYAYGKKFLKPGDEILLPELEHHANIVPWQLVAKETGARVVMAPINDLGEIMMDEYQRLLSPSTKIVGISQVSNSLGTITPVKNIVELAHRYGAIVLVDAAQSVAHQRVNVQELDADFLVFSGHKIYGPTGIGAVYGKKELLEMMLPWQGGGNMILDVTFEETKYNVVPSKFEAGTPNIADTVGLEAALHYVSDIGLENISSYEHELTDYAMSKLSEIPGLRLIGTAPEKISILSFVIPGLDSQTIGKYLDSLGIALRVGHHCAQPAIRHFGIEQTVRPSLAMYNTKDEVDRLVDALRSLAKK
ncbi:SufS family cysteine desulfurase [Bacteroidota bacterium]